MTQSAVEWLVRILVESGQWTVRDLVRGMERFEGADYSNWGISLLSGTRDVIFFGFKQEGTDFWVPLLEVVDWADREYGDFGYEELFFVHQILPSGAIQWGLYCPQDEAPQ